MASMAAQTSVTLTVTLELVCMTLRIPATLCSKFEVVPEISSFLATSVPHLPTLAAMKDRPKNNARPNDETVYTLSKSDEEEVEGRKTLNQRLTVEPENGDDVLLDANGDV